MTDGVGGYMYPTWPLSSLKNKHDGQPILLL